MGNELQSLNERIAERIGKDLVELIPKDQWQVMVDKEVQKFRMQIAPRIIRELLSDAYVKRVKLSINELTCTTEWSSITNKYTLSKLKEFLGESGGEMFAAVLSPAMSMVLQDLRRKLDKGY